MILDEIIKAVEPLPTFMPEEDMRAYFKYANLVNNGLIVDLGTGWGKSMVVLALANPSNRLFSCDPGNYPIYQGWASNKFHYYNKINKVIKDYGLENVEFFQEEAQLVITELTEKADIIHLDNWSEMNGFDSTVFLQECIAKIKDKGYFLARNYGRGDREEYTQSVDRATKEMIKIETIGLVTIFQK